MDSGIDLASYAVPITTRIANALRLGFGARFQIVYEGDPIDIPVALLPCLVVEKTNGSVAQDATGFDEVRSTVVIKVLMNKRADFGSTKTQQFTHMELLRLIEGRDPITLQYMSDSILGIIRTQFTLTTTIVDQTFDINYDIGFRPKDLISAEGRLTMQVTELIPVPVRS